MSEYHQARDHVVVFDRSDHGKLELTGPDAAKHLHNLSTNDILSLADGAGCEAFFCTVKGRVVSHLWVWRRDRDGQPAYWLALPSGQAPAVFKHLIFYRLNLNVEVADRTAELAQFHVAGPEAEALVKRLDLTDCDVRPHTQLSVPGYDVLCPTARAADVKQRLVQEGAALASPETFEVMRVEAGMPAFGPDIDDNRLVFEVGRVAQAVSYNKGCYLGQEPIVMARDRGHINRLLLGLKVESDNPVSSGSKVFRDGQEVGVTTSSVVSPRLGALALAYLRRGHWDAGTAVEVESAAGRVKAAVSGLPFAG